MPSSTSGQLLNNRDYTASEVLETERKAVFSGGWVSIGLESNVGPGSAHPVHVASIPLLITRTREGVLQVFHNVRELDNRFM